MPAIQGLPGGVTTRRHRHALGVLVGLLVAVPILETYLLIRVGHAIGGLATVAILVAEALVGAWLTRREGSRAWQALRRTLGSGQLPADQLTDAALVLVGGVLLMLPGFLTDVVGFVFLLPFTRPVARRIVNFFAAQQVARAGIDPRLLRMPMDRGSTIEGEVVDEPAPQQNPRRQPDDPQAEPPAISGTVL